MEDSKELNNLLNEIEESSGVKLLWKAQDPIISGYYLWSPIGTIYFIVEVSIDKGKINFLRETSTSIKDPLWFGPIKIKTIGIGNYNVSNFFIPENEGAACSELVIDCTPEEMRDLEENLQSIRITLTVSRDENFKEQLNKYQDMQHKNDLMEKAMQQISISKLQELL